MKYVKGFLLMDVHQENVVVGMNQNVKDCSRFVMMMKMYVYNAWKTAIVKISLVDHTV